MGFDLLKKVVEKKKVELFTLWKEKSSLSEI